MFRNNNGFLQIDKRESGSMITRDEFLERINQEGFSFSIEIPRRIFWDFKSLVFRRRISEEDLYQMFYNYCWELENCLKEAERNAVCSLINFQLVPFMINIKQNLIQRHQTAVIFVLSLSSVLTIV